MTSCKDKYIKVPMQYTETKHKCILFEDASTMNPIPQIDDDPNGLGHLLLQDNET